MKINYFVFSLSLIIILFVCNICISQDQKSSKLSILDLQCKETVCFIPVDSLIAKQLIPTNLKLYTEENGAQILVIAQDCESAILNGTELAPLQMTHVWIRIDGPKIVTPLDGVNVTLDTYYWWDYAGKTTNEELSRAITLTAKNLDLTESIEFNLMDKGKVIETTNIGDMTGYEWFTTPIPNNDTVGINHIVYGRMGDKALTLNDSGIVRFLSRGGQTKFVIQEYSILSVFGSELVGISFDFNMNFRAALGTSIAKD